MSLPPTGHTAQYLTIARALGVALEEFEARMREWRAGGHPTEDITSALGLEARGITIAILAATLCESLAFAILSTVCTPAQLKDTDDRPLEDKWLRLIPHHLATPRVVFPKELQRELRSLIYLRNGIAHAKPRVFSADNEDKIIHHGNAERWNGLSYSAIVGFAALPPKLLSCIKAQHHETLMCIDVDDFIYERALATLQKQKTGEVAPK